ncbi:unnamed protein product [Strongylus vulgaris]|uniref:Uncharacterized protein n=1 Tax=Strongylus vulgaris TaxID=40348 RepID=A0A3P7IL17_STRVU|nr:unnamed protein product [Strongylus vulgaris]
MQNGQCLVPSIKTTKAQTLLLPEKDVAKLIKALQRILDSHVCCTSGRGTCMCQGDVKGHASTADVTLTNQDPGFWLGHADRLRIGNDGDSARKREQQCWLVNSDFLDALTQGKASF